MASIKERLMKSKQDGYHNGGMCKNVYRVFQEYPAMYQRTKPAVVNYHIIPGKFIRLTLNFCTCLLLHVAEVLVFWRKLDTN